MVILADRCNGQPLRRPTARTRSSKKMPSSTAGGSSGPTEDSRFGPAADAEEESQPTHSVAPAVKTPLKSHVYLVGMGPGDAGLVTFKAAAVLQQADCVFCFDYLKNEVARYVPRTKIEVAPPTLMGRFRGQDLKTLSPELRQRARQNEEELATFVPQVRRMVAAKKTVVFADAGDPTIYCPWSWVTDEFADLGAAGDSRPELLQCRQRGDWAEHYEEWRLDHHFAGRQLGRPGRARPAYRHAGAVYAPRRSRRSWCRGWRPTIRPIRRWPWCAKPATSGSRSFLPRLGPFGKK